MRDERGIDLAGRRSKHLNEFAGQRFDWVISLCDRVREVCPEFPGTPGGDPLEHPRPGPRAGATTTQTLPAFQRTAAELATRIGFLLAAIRPDQRHRGGHHACLTRSSTSATWSTTSRPPSTSTPTHFGFELRTSAAPAFADVVRGHLRLLLSGPESSAGRPMPDGRTPEPGGWNRIHLIVDDIAAEVARLRAAGLRVPQRHRHRPGRPADPARRPRRQPVELFQPAGT